MYRTLRDFIDALDKAGELKRISAPVSPILEISEITHRMAREDASMVGTTGRHTDRLNAGLGGYALLFENIEGCDSDIPVAVNLFGSYHRMEMALGCHHEGGHTPGGFNAIARRIGALVQPKPPSGIGEALHLAKQFLPLLRIGPKRVKHGRCQEVVTIGNEVNLFEIPFIKCWPLDGDPASVGWPIPNDQPDTSPGQGRFVTLAGMYTIHADDRDAAKPTSRNIGMYRAQLIDRNRFAMHWHIHHDGAAHWRSWKKIGKPMPLAIVLGGESVLPYAATAPLPPGISEILMAGFLNRGSIPLVRCRTIPLDVPANAEIVIEGLVSTECGQIDFDPEHDTKLGQGAVLEGPFGDHTGFYSLPDRYPIMNVTAVTRCRNPIYPTTIVGLPPQEDYYLGKATERIFFPLLKTLIHDIEDYDLPLFGCFHNCAAVQIRKDYALQARRVMHAVWGAGQMAWTKIIIVVDHDVDVHHVDAVLEAIFEQCHFGRDLEFVNGPLDILDHAAPHLGAGTKLGFDATKKVHGEDVNGIPVAEAHADSEGLTRVADPTLRIVRPEQLPELEGDLCIQLAAIEQLRDLHLPAYGRGRCMCVQIEKHRNNNGSARSILEATLRKLHEIDSPVEFVLAVDADVDLKDRDAMWFRLGANADPGRDMVRIEESAARIAFDCTIKSPTESQPGRPPVRSYPPLLDMPKEIRARVDKRWSSDFGFDPPRSD